MWPGERAVGCPRVAQGARRLPCAVLTRPWDAVKQPPGWHPCARQMCKHGQPQRSALLEHFQPQTLGASAQNPSVPPARCRSGRRGRGPARGRLHCLRPAVSPCLRCSDHQFNSICEVAATFPVLAALQATGLALQSCDHGVSCRMESDLKIRPSSSVGPDDERVPLRPVSPSAAPATLQGTRCHLYCRQSF